ncbi:MAG: hypothetical protein ACE5EM_06450 [Sphingomonadales bacterium]
MFIDRVRRRPDTFPLSATGGDPLSGSRAQSLEMFRSVFFADGTLLPA